MINFLLHSEDSCRWMLGESRITILSALTARLLSLPESKFSSFFKILKSRWVLETLQADSSCSADTKPECYCLQVSQHCSVAAFICRVLAKPNAAKLLQIPASISGLYLLKGMNAKHSGCEQNGFFVLFCFSPSINTSLCCKKSEGYHEFFLWTNQRKETPACSSCCTTLAFLSSIASPPHENGSLPRQLNWTEVIYVVCAKRKGFVRFQG